MLFPNSQRINRGDYEVKQLLEACRSNEVTDLIVLHERRGVPTQLVVSYLSLLHTVLLISASAVTKHGLCLTQ